MTTLASSPDETLPSQLHADLVEMLRAARTAERDIFGMLSGAEREAPNTIGSWSAKDALAHLAAWRSIEARNLEATIRGEAGTAAGDPGPNVPIDDANAMLHDRYAAWG